MRRPWRDGVSLLILMMLLWCATTVQAFTYYVSAGGHGEASTTNSNSCTTARTITTTKGTISGATGGISCLAAGDTLSIRGGTYSEQVSSITTLFPSGTDFGAGVITIASYPGESATIVGTLNVQTNADNSGVQYVVFDRLIVDAGGSSGQITETNNAVRFCATNVNHIKFQNGEARNANTSIFQVGCSSTDIQVLNNNIYGAFVALYGGTHPTESFYGLYYNGSGGLIEGNVIHDNTGYGLHLYHGVNDVNNNVIRNNIFYNNCFDDGERNIQLNAAILASGSNNQFYNNILYNNTCNGNGAAIMAFSTDGGNNTQIYNNTVYNQNGACIEIYPTAPQTTVKNNLCHTVTAGITDDGATGTVADHNLCFNNSSNAGCDITGGDPQFVSTSAPDFHLQTGSAAKDVGTSLSGIFTRDIVGVTRPQGSAWDIGAYEYVSGGAPAPHMLRVIR